MIIGLTAKLNLVDILFHDFIQYISVYNTNYYCIFSSSQHVSAVHGHHQMSLIR
jgi:hypothetical protein